MSALVGFEGTLNSYLRQHRDLAICVNSEEFLPGAYHEKYDELFWSSHEYARRFLKQVGSCPGGAAWSSAAKLLRQHELHSEILLQSQFIEHAYRKPYGYAGDKDLMLLIYENADRGASPYAVLKNRVYQSLPAAEAVRRRISSIESRIRDLQPGSKVLSLACGPAREISRYVSDFSEVHDFDILDHDGATVQYTSHVIRDRRVRHIVASAFDIVKGQKEFADCSLANSAGRAFVLQEGHYDFIYSAGLYDYIRDYPSNPNRGVKALTKRLFLSLKPGGRLLIGNFLVQSEGNPHLMNHRLMMELYSEWCLIYRTKEEIFDFAGTISPAMMSATLYNEFLDDPYASSGVVGFIDILRRS
jgi:hypothetical protein